MVALERFQLVDEKLVVLALLQFVVDHTIKSNLQLLEIVGRAVRERAKTRSILVQRDGGRRLPLSSQIHCSIDHVMHIITAEAALRHLTINPMIVTLLITLLILLLLLLHSSHFLLRLHVR